MQSARTIGRAGGFCSVSDAAHDAHMFCACSLLRPSPEDCCQEPEAKHNDPQQREDEKTVGNDLVAHDGWSGR